MIKKLKDYLRWKIYKGLYKPGHYYSTIPSLQEVEENSDKIFSSRPPEGIQFQLESQKTCLREIQSFLVDFCWPENRSKEFRYYSNNSYFNSADAKLLFGMMRKYRPSRIIEIGSGFSSALMMDTNQFFFNGSLNMTFIEPYPDRLNSLMCSADKIQYQLLRQVIQDVPINTFSQLKENDILFVDSSHVSKVGSDLNHILFNILPVLNKGVLIHFHDITYPFEYPKKWIMEGIYWNEAYLIRAFLMYNSSFEIVFMNHYWANNHVPKIDSLGEGGSLWIQKIG